MLGIELIQLALGNRQRLSHVPTSAEWAEAYQFAEKQSMVGICYAGIQRLGASAADMRQHLSMDDMMEWVGQAEAVRTQNRAVNAAIAPLLSGFRQLGLHGVVLKGQGLAAYYGELAPLRTSGDVDFWVPELLQDGVKTRAELEQQLQRRLGEMTYHHVEFGKMRGVEVELHYRPSWFYCPWHNRRFQRWAEAEAQRLGNPEFQKSGISEIPAPSADFNRLYLMVHIYRHLFNEGIGLRQLLDYYMVLRATSTSQVPSSKFQVPSMVRELGMERFAQALMWVLASVFEGDPLTDSGTEDQDGRFLLDEVMRAGNFGKYDERLTYDRTKPLERGWGRIRRMQKLLRFGFWEVVCAPGWKVWHYLWRRRRGGLT